MIVTAEMYSCIHISYYLLIFCILSNECISFVYYNIRTFKRMKKLIYGRIHIDMSQFKNSLKGCSYGGELARLGRLARLGETSPSLKKLL